MNIQTLICLSLLVLGCKTQDDSLVGKPPSGGDDLVAKPRQITSSEKKGPERPRYPDPLLTVATWPFNEERTTFELTWNGGNKPLPLHEQPDPNSPLLGDVVWKNGERIAWQNSVVAVYAPMVVRAKEEWSVEGPTYSEGYLTNDDYVSETLKKGQAIDVYLYAGSGQCYLGLGGKIFMGLCPPRESFTGSFTGKVRSEWYQPVKKVWWIQITDGTTSGWFPMDDRVLVDIQSG